MNAEEHRYPLRKFGKIDNSFTTMPAPENSQSQSTEVIIESQPPALETPGTSAAGETHNLPQPPGFSPLPRNNVHVEPYSGRGDPVQW